ncbi:MAG: tRNA glutamyl-Q(34) synthetase GluQRS [Betaproteobacteria bacterium]|nr:tRNA glutamyl-Q(34) synthetase GluQRS [Betaproteobacteria bacterium]
MAEYVGRFAPSPTGPLHFGSLVAALASYEEAHAAQGRWRLRLDDLDRPRTQPGATDEILRALERLGFEWDGPVLVQSERLERYRAAVDELTRRGLAYPCSCTRKELEDSALALDGARIYPGTCRQGIAPGKVARALRLRTHAAPIGFADAVQGWIEQRVQKEVGDFVLLRADGIIAYQLAVVVDDMDQGVTDVVRGADLLDSTPRQIHLQRLLGARTPRYAHVPVALNASGEKLSKQTGARPLDLSDPKGELARARRFLGQDANGWDLGRVPRVRAIAAPG